MKTDNSITDVPGIEVGHAQDEAALTGCTAILKKIKATEGKKRLIKASAVEDWRELRAMGVLKEQDGTLVLTALGARIATQEEK